MQYATCKWVDLDCRSELRDGNGGLIAETHTAVGCKDGKWSWQVIGHPLVEGFAGSRECAIATVNYKLLMLALDGAELQELIEAYVKSSPLEMVAMTLPHYVKEKKVSVEQAVEDAMQSTLTTVYLKMREMGIIQGPTEEDLREELKASAGLAPSPPTSFIDTEGGLDEGLMKLLTQGAAVALADEAPTG